MAGGYRGYIFSRPFGGARAPQHVQNLVIRDYAARKGIAFLLSATEYAMPDCYMILDQLLDAVPSLDGIILYSMFMLPPDPARRGMVLDRALAAGRTLHCAVEEVVVGSPAEARACEDIFRIRSVMATQSPIAC